MYKLSDLPDALAYVEAFASLGSKIKPIQLEILRHQYNAPDRTLSASDLTPLVELSSPVQVNGYYGRLGHAVANAMNYLPSLRESGGYRWWAVLSAGYTAKDGRFYWIMHEQVAEALVDLGWVQAPIPIFPDELSGRDATLVEGARSQVWVNRYERDNRARQLCIDHYGTACVVCEQRLEDRYGAIARGFIHVHHIVPISEIGGSYNVDPIADLRPVCPNCHAMLHRRSPPYSIDELRTMLGSSRTWPN